MPLIEILLALGLLQLWGANNPLHKDGWFYRWVISLGGFPLAKTYAVLPLLLGVLVPSVVVGVVYLWLPTFFGVVLAAVVLSYCFGRGEFAADLENYLKACSDSDWLAACATASEQGAQCQSVEFERWQDLHEKMLTASAYQGFERLFAVLFWFLVAGPAGALLYRLSFIYRSKFGGTMAKEWLWVIEWPAVRLLGISFAVTGNFVGCFNRWRRWVGCFKSASDFILFQSVMGALSVDDEIVHNCDVTQRELSALKRLYARTLWMWVAVAAIAVIAL